MDDKNVLDRINGLVDEEHKLREQLRRGEISGDEEHARLKELEEALDQCWDLLRRRRAAREVGNDPNVEQAHGVTEVEGYLQ
jgi:coenzyme F420-reducing hydrogenase alpha subunit